MYTFKDVVLSIRPYTSSSPFFLSLYFSNETPLSHWDSRGFFFPILSETQVYKYKSGSHCEV